MSMPIIYTAVEFIPVETGYTLNTYHVAGSSFQEAARRFQSSRQKLFSIHGKMEAYITTDVSFEEKDDAGIVQLPMYVEEFMSTVGKHNWVRQNTADTVVRGLITMSPWVRV